MCLARQAFVSPFKSLSRSARTEEPKMFAHLTLTRTILPCVAEGQVTFKNHAVSFRVLALGSLTQGLRQGIMIGYRGSKNMLSIFVGGPSYLTLFIPRT
jgi:hypothetical protein